MKKQAPAGAERSPVISLLLLLAIIILSGCAEEKVKQKPFPNVTYLEISSESITLTKELAGRTSAFFVSEVRPQVSGIIQERLFKEGADVSKGEVLYQIDPALYEATYTRAKATLKQAEAELVALRLLADRYRKIVEKKAISRQEYDNALSDMEQVKAKVAAAQADVESAAINLEYTRVVAPISGRIGRSSVTQGALVTQNQATALATIQKLDTVYVDVTQSSAEVLRMRHDLASGKLRSSGEDSLRVLLKLENGNYYARHRGPAAADGANGAGRNVEIEPIAGRLEFSDVTVDQNMGVVSLRAVFPNSDGQLMPGMYVRAIIEEGVKTDAILVPQRAVVKNNRGESVAYVLVPRDGETKDGDPLFTLESRILGIDRAIDNKWLVTAGLKPGDRLLYEGLLAARPGQLVKGELAIGAAAKTALAENSGMPSGSM